MHWVSITFPLCQNFEFSILRYSQRSSVVTSHEGLDVIRTFLDLCGVFTLKNNEGSRIKFETKIVNSITLLKSDLTYLKDSVLHPEYIKTYIMYLPNFYRRHITGIQQMKKCRRILGNRVSGGV